MKKVIGILCVILFFVSTIFGVSGNDDRQDIRGFLYLSNIYGEEFKPIHPRALINLGESLKKYTKITIQFNRSLYLSDRRIFNLPFLYLVTDEPFELTRQEIENLKKYVAQGGFILADNGNAVLEHGPAEASFRKMFKQVFGLKSGPKVIPKKHDLYKAFFTFEDGPPLGSEVGFVTVSKKQSAVQAGYESKPVEYLEGFYHEDRLAGIYCDKGYGKLWNENYGNEPQLKMGVNMVIYALTQPESIYQKHLPED